MAEILDTTRAVIAWSADRAEFLAAGRAALLPFTEDLPDARGRTLGAATITPDRLALHDRARIAC
jgi:hypothetical protein